ncbi:hypothetical protein KKC1_26140 [Calderihabitans maritimus]|uniref:Uncharacterized protein n=1 Tax=Calderihabitans maritimus TaxID=1246530 RepID=A0A1Z5HVD3_9FIRM|nr:hypothetical protein KKC1_26140 [Calderihabitans maritimus]
MQLFRLIKTRYYFYFYKLSLFPSRPVNLLNFSKTDGGIA